MNGRLAAKIVTGVGVVLVGGICIRGAEDWLGFSGIEARVAMAQESAEAASKKADQCCAKAHQNETEIAKAQERLEAVQDNVDWIRRNLAHFMTARGVSPVSPPATSEGGAP